MHIGYQFRPQWWTAGLEMTWIGIIVAVVTYGLGLSFGSLG
jgi:VIT1/CCC1 family predicted Fe2+/Mn2+ transporter